MSGESGDINEGAKDSAAIAEKRAGGRVIGGRGWDGPAGYV